MPKVTPIGVRLPSELKDWVKRQAAQNFTSQNAEIVRSIRERMQAATGEGLGNSAPAAALDHQRL